MKLLTLTPDLHGQEKDLTAWKVHLNAVKWLEPDLHVILGDWGEYASVSQHPKDSLDVPSLGEEYEIANCDLNTLDDALPSGCRKWFLEGNHEYRVRRWLYQKADNLEGGLQLVPEALKLRERGWAWVPYGEPLEIGRAKIIHGSYTNKYHASKHCDSYGDSVFYGDTHTWQVHATTHGTKPHVGISFGCLCKLKPRWLHGRPSSWMHGFGLVYVDEKTGNFWPYFVPIIDGIAVVNGHIICKEGVQCAGKGRQISLSRPEIRAFYQTSE